MVERKMGIAWERSSQKLTFRVERSECTSAVGGYTEYGVSTMAVQICVRQRCGCMDRL